MGDIYDPSSKIVCDNCLLPESEHVFAIGSRAMNKNKEYICNGYSQRKLLIKEEHAKSNK